MTLDTWMCVYFVGALVTAINVRHLTRFYRCTLLWPLFWLYILWKLARMLHEDIERRCR